MQKKILNVRVRLLFRLDFKISDISSKTFIEIRNIDIPFSEAFIRISHSPLNVAGGRKIVMPDMKFLIIHLRVKILDVFQQEQADIPCKELQ